MFFIPIPIIFNKCKDNKNESEDKFNNFIHLQNSGYVDDMIQKHTSMLIEAAQVPIIDPDVSEEERKNIIDEHNKKRQNIMKQIKSEKKDVYGF